MTAITGRNAFHLDIAPRVIRGGSGLTAWAGKATIAATSLSTFVSLTSINSQFLIDSLACEIGSGSSLTASAIAVVNAQVWPGSGVLFSFQNGVGAAIPVVVHYKFANLQ